MPADYPPPLINTPRGWRTVRYTDPPCQYPRLKLSTLPDPPEDFHPWGETWSELYRTRRLTLPDAQKLCQFHFFAIDPEFPHRFNRVHILQALFKLLYNQLEIHRPCTWEGFLDMRRDAGPRLIDPQHGRPGSLLPISRWYPNPPQTNTVTDPENYWRPGNVHPDWTDAELEQFLISSCSAPPNLPLNGGGSNGPTSSDGSNNTPIEPSSSTGNEHQPIQRSTSTKGRARVIPRSRPAGNYNNNIEITEEVRSSARVLLENQFLSTAANITCNLSLPQGKARKIIEAVERALIDIAYTDLERHPSAAPLVAPRPITATALSDLSKSTIGSFSATSQVRLTHGVNTMTLDPDGHPYPYRGRGPVTPNQDDPAALVDCVIVAGKLLDVGSTNADRKRQGWHTRLTPVQRAFIELTDVNWDLCPPDVGTQLKKAFCNMVALEVAGPLGAKSPNVRDLWQLAADNFDQFQATFVETQSGCLCATTSQEQTRAFDCYYVETIALNQDQDGVTMEELMKRTFEVNHLLDCVSCTRVGSISSQRLFRTLPPRIAVRVHQGALVHKQTQTITIPYRDETKAWKTAVYRWLGGIYYQGGKYRVFWTDNERGEANTGEIRIFDSTENHGMIIGGIAPANQDDRVPENWCKSTPPPLLFYERVINPSEDALRLAIHTTCDMLRTVRNKKQILNEHVPWEQPAIHSGEDYPWPRNLPTLEVQHFQFAEGSYNLNGNQAFGGHITTLRNAGGHFLHGGAVNFGGEELSDSTFAAYLPPLPSVGPATWSPSAFQTAVGGDMVAPMGSPSGLSTLEGLGLGRLTPSNTGQNFMLLTEGMDPIMTAEDTMMDLGEGFQNPEQLAQGFRLTPILPNSVDVPPLPEEPADFSMDFNADVILPSMEGFDVTPSPAPAMLARVSSASPKNAQSDGVMNDLDFSEFIEMDMTASCRGNPQPRPALLIPIRRLLKRKGTEKRVIEEIESDEETEQTGDSKKQKMEKRIVRVAKRPGPMKQSLRKQTLQWQAFKKVGQK